MTSIFVQFSDAEESEVIGCAAGPQPIESWPYQGELDSSDARWKAYYASKNDTPLAQIGLPAPD
jgi:hypothetical protein